VAEVGGPNGFWGRHICTCDLHQRVLTYGGQAPPLRHNSTTISLPYTVLYIFWQAK
jgi:hypothetical protein